MDREYWSLIGRKIVETLISVKVWVIFSLMIISTCLLIYNLIDGKTWGTVNTAVVSTVLALREGFKMARVKKPGEENIDFDDEHEHKEHRKKDKKNITIFT